ncbi:hypothetical protein SCHPADRAFT_689250 [Schizopora paradoxa]|uniref:Uncharacterized protein n=1 Tax=Schizopora paradoxa TaxID=27342 RepID=A0A0H2RAG9_9AGAM|nr:hypothetical protein SCHPADRAFT_689250 [Schizopora paradoxa]
MLSSITFPIRTKSFGKSIATWLFNYQYSRSPCTVFFCYCLFISSKLLALHTDFLYHVSCYYHCFVF